MTMLFGFNRGRRRRRGRRQRLLLYWLMPNLHPGWDKFWDQEWIIRCVEKCWRFGRDFVYCPIGADASAAYDGPAAAVVEAVVVVVEAVVVAVVVVVVVAVGADESIFALLNTRLESHTTSCDDSYISCVFRPVFLDLMTRTCCCCCCCCCW